MENEPNIAKNPTKTVKIKSPEYPGLLRQIHAPPNVLYYRGYLLPAASVNIAVVGSRKISSYGQQAMERIILPLAGQNICIVSGLAYGADAYAHELALRAGLKTIAVLGSGVDDDSIYPSANRDLAHRIIEAGGAVLSEFPPGTQGLPYHFPKRNLIIAGMSKATIVIEAAQKSGALITSDLATKENRDVFAVPGSIFNPLSQGCNNLIKDGAFPITGAADLMEKYAGKYADLSVKKAGFDASAARAVDATELSVLEQKIFGHIHHDPVGADEIKARSGLDMAQVNYALATLEMKEKIRNCGGQNFVRSAPAA